MKKSFYISLLCILSMGAIHSVLADNPLFDEHFFADPTTVVVGDSIFYLIVDTDDENIDNYNIKAYYLLSSKDMKNWTNHGEVFRVPRDVPWANGAWAPAAAWRNGKMFIYFPNGASGIGVVSSENPVGPYKDEVGGPIIDPSKGQCDGIAWCFDPGVFVDTDGQAYLIWGGGDNAARPYGNNFSMVKLNENMISWSGNIIQMKGMDKSFEASYITKRNNTYYLSYNNTSQKIDYATSSSPMGPWSYKGQVLDNPNINGQNINSYNNNHHGFSEFKGKWYAAYHDRRVAIAQNTPEPAFHRSVSVDLLEYNDDGSFKPLVFTNSGPNQIGNFNPYDSIPATTASLQKNISSRTVQGNNAPPYNLLIPKPSKDGGSWVRISDANFESGALAFQINAASLNSNNKVIVRTGSETGNVVGTCNLVNTGSWSNFSDTECEVTNLAGVVSSVYLTFEGSDSTAALKWWSFTSTPKEPPVPQAPYQGIRMEIPGQIEAENYDVGGDGVAYYDVDAINQGEEYRDDGVDVVAIENGYAVGYTELEEWLQYSIKVNESSIYQWEAKVSSGVDGAAFRIWLDDIDITGLMAVPNTGDWDTYVNISGVTPEINAGEYILKIDIEEPYGNIDWIQFNNNLTPLKNEIKIVPIVKSNMYYIYNLSGVLVASLDINNFENTLDNISNVSRLDSVKKLALSPGIYFLKDSNSFQIHRVMIE